MNLADGKQTTVGVGVLTFDHIRTGRQEDFRRTWESIHDAGYPAEFKLLTNGSTDGTQDVVRKLGGIVDDTRRQIWYGNQRLVDELIHNDLVVLSADDLEYDEGWLARVVRFMDAAPDEVALASAYLEACWSWNEPIETVEYGGETAVIRASVCGSSWVFRSRDWLDWMGPFPQFQPGEDLHIVQSKIQPLGYRCAALDLTEHIGIERSAWGNQSHLSAVPFDRSAWGLPERPVPVAD